MIFSKPYDKQGCQNSHNRVARFLVFPIYFHKNHVRDIKFGRAPYFGPRNRLVKFSKPYDQQGCQFASHGCQIFSFLYYFHKNNVRDIKISKAPYFGSRNRLMKFSKPYDQQGCHMFSFFLFSSIITIKQT